MIQFNIKVGKISLRIFQSGNVYICNYKKNSAYQFVYS